jgi:geranylgeranyl diphosphate synthase type I
MTDSALASLIGPMTAELDSALRRIVAGLPGPQDGLPAMVSYAMGWTGPGAGPETAGKHVRPLLCLLSAGAAGSDWRTALPPACAVEFIHSFSLIHDDIQDESPLRRGRSAVWVQYGPAHAINIGDAVFALAFSTIADGDPPSSPVILPILADVCRRLTTGQYLDMTYAKMEGISLSQYQEMIAEKTAALIAAASRLGAAAAGVSAEQQEAYAAFGHALGMAFQVQDDYLGIWGDPDLTGKATGGDLLGRKKSYPILYGIDRSAVFRALLNGDLTPELLPRLVAELETSGAREQTLRQVEEWSTRAYAALHSASPRGDCGAALEELTASLLQRQK